MMNSQPKSLLVSKTFYAGLAMAIFGVIQIAMGETDKGVATLLQGFTIIGFRDAMKKGA